MACPWLHKLLFVTVLLLLLRYPCTCRNCNAESFWSCIVIGESTINLLLAIFSARNKLMFCNLTVLLTFVTQILLSSEFQDFFLTLFKTKLIGR
jgi:hypothetical protein